VTQITERDAASEDYVTDQQEVASPRRGGHHIWRGV